MGLINKAIDFVKQQPWVSLGVVLTLPLIAVIGFTLAGPGAPSKGGKEIPKVIVTKKNISEVINDAAELLKKNDYETFALKVRQEIKSENINMPDVKGNTLFISAVNYGNEEAVQLIYHLGGDVNQPNPFTGETPLMAALRKKDDYMTELLVAAGAKLNVADNYGATPLLIAAETQNQTWVDKLISRGASAGATGENLLKFVSRKNAVGVNAMLKSGVNPNLKDKSGYTPLYMAASLGELEMVRWLVSYKANMETPAADGSTPVIGAARYRKADALEFLIDKGANVNAKNTNGETALYFASANNMVKSVEQLLLLKADASVKTNRGYTPYKIAAEKKFTAILAVFKKNNIAA